METDTMIEDRQHEENIPENMESTQVDYFGVDNQETVYLPDGTSYIIVQELDEGARRKYLNKTNRDIRLERQTGDAHLKMATGDDRFHLLETAIVGWNLVRKDKQGNVQPIPYNDKNLRDFLTMTRPSLLDKVEEKVQEMNPWLMPTDATVDAIDEQIEELQKQRTKLLEREEGKES
jgi:hypothetical protein